MKEKAIRKINKIGEIGGVITLVCKIVIIIGLVGCLIGAIALAVLPRDLVNVQLNGNAIVDIDWSRFNVDSSQIKINGKDYDNQSAITSSFSIDGMEFGVNDVQYDDNGMVVDASMSGIEFSLRSFIVPVLTGMIGLGLTLMTLFFVGALCKSIKTCNSPFEENVIKKMQNLAISLIPWVLFSSISQSITTSMFTGKFNIVKAVDCKMIFVILIIFALVYIFKYGAVLQQESDETL